MGWRTKVFGVVLVAGGAWAWWNADRLGGCIGSTQSIRLLLDESRVVACDTATIAYISPSPSPMAHISCGDEQKTIHFHQRRTSEAICGLRVTLVEAAQDYRGDDVGAFDLTW
jgi:hypothetical protein